MDSGGQLRQHYQAGQENQLGALGLTPIVHEMTVSGSDGMVSSVWDGQSAIW